MPDCIPGWWAGCAGTRSCARFQSAHSWTTDGTMFCAVAGLGDFCRRSGLIGTFLYGRRATLAPIAPDAKTFAFDLMSLSLPAGHFIRGVYVKDEPQLDGRAPSSGAVVGLSNAFSAGTVSMPGSSQNR